MTAPTRQFSTARAQDFHKIHPVDTAPRAFRHLSVVAEHHTGSVVFARDAPGYDPDDTGVPVFVEQHDPRQGQKLRLHQTLRFLRDATFDVLTLAVKRVQLLRRVFAKLRIVTDQQLHRQRRIGEPSASVDPRSQAKRNIGRCKSILGSHARHGHERTQSGPFRRL